MPLVENTKYETDKNLTTLLSQFLDLLVLTLRVAFKCLNV